MPGRKPLEQKRRTARSATKDSAGRPLPDRANVVALPGSNGEPPKLPDTIEEHGPGGERWRRTWTHGKDWISTATDYDLVVRLCEAEDLRAAMKGELADRGFTVIGSMGQERVNPLVDKIRLLDDQITRYERELGFTPSSRGSLGVGEVGAERSASPLEQILLRQAKRKGA